LHDRAGLLIRLQRLAALLGTFRNRAMPKRGRHQSTDVFHEEKLGLHRLNETQKLPQKRSARVLNGPPSAGRTEALTRRSTDEEI
jgi:hypothetical protein